MRWSSGDCCVVVGSRSESCGMRPVNPLLADTWSTFDPPPQALAAGLNLLAFDDTSQRRRREQPAATINIIRQVAIPSNRLPLVVPDFRAIATHLSPTCRQSRSNQKA